MADIISILFDIAIKRSRFNSFFETIRPVKEIRFQLPLIVYSRSREIYIAENVRLSRTVEKPLHPLSLFPLSRKILRKYDNLL